MRARALLLTLGLSFLAACDTSPSDGEPASTAGAEEDRGGLGKADLVGSCEFQGYELCDGPGVGNCWCDDLCVYYGDCCHDADDVCGIDVPEPEGEPCGGFLGDTCGENEYCAYEPGAYCGAADATAICEVRPEVCIEVYAPVCGCDGNTYSNSCFAAMAGTGVATEGECEPPPPGGFCGGIAGIQCPEGQVCVDDENDDCDPALGGADCGGVCVIDDGPDCSPVLCELYCENGFAVDEDGCEVCSCAEPEPEPTECVVSGCNSEICADQPMFSPCVALPEFACYQTAECGNFGEDGACGWKPTEELTSCLEGFDE